MNRFAALLDRLADAADGRARRRLLTDYLAVTAESDRAIAVGVLARSFRTRRVKLALIRGLAEARLDPKLFALSRAYVGDIVETIALAWPARPGANKDPSLSEIVEALATLGASELPRRIELWLDAADANGRWALIKLLTGTLPSPVTAEDIDHARNAVGMAPTAAPLPIEEWQEEMFETGTAGEVIAGTCAAVLMYVERGRSRASPVTCTFGVWKDDAIVPVGRTHLGLVPEDVNRIDAFVRDNTVNRFGPVREVARSGDTGLVLEVAFEGLERSPRHKSGIAMRAARIARLCPDRRPLDADKLEALERLLPAR